MSVNYPSTESAPGPGDPIPAFEAAAVLTPTMIVPPEWIDYNGHMNVAYYTRAFDVSSEHIFGPILGVGEAFAKRDRMGPMILQQTLHYIGELLEGEAFHCAYRLLDWDAKRLHFYGEMIKDSDGSLCAVSESLSINVDLDARRSVAYPDWAQARIRALGESQAGLPRPERAGAAIGIRRKG